MPVCESRDAAVNLLNWSSDFVQTNARTLPHDEIHVWQLCEVEQHSLDSLKDLLSQDELERAARFRFSKDRDRFIASRGVLRTLLAAYLGCDPGSLHFQYSEKGKPQLPAAPDLQFNVAHSGEIIVWAFARKRRVGIDVEEIRTDFSTPEIAERFFSKSERQALRSLPTTQRHLAFFRCWTRKEAFVKATGDGLSLPLDQFDVTLAPGQPAQLLQTRPDHRDAERWTMHNLDLHPNYAAALVIERHASPER